jgi:hypothetical protein
MKKLYILFFTLLTASFSFAQGNETFDGFTATGSSYTDGTFTGQDGSTWTYVQSRGDQSITGKSIMLGRSRTPQAEVYSGTISGGVGTISFNYQQAFSTAVNLNVLVNDIVYGTVTSSDQTVQNSGSITVNQPGDVVIKFISVTNTDGQVTIDDVIWTGFTGSATPAIAVSSPSDNSIYPSGTTSVDVEFTAVNTNPGDQVNITVNGVTLTDVSSPVSVPTLDGQTYSVLVELIDSGSTLLDSDTVSFEVLLPCDLQLETINTVCDAVTAGTDTYTTTIAFTGGGTSQYTIDTGGVGSVGGDNPTTDATGTIIITGVNEGVDFTVSVLGDPGNSSCDLTRNITAPSCIPVVCPNPGDIIITEIMQNPAAVGDNSGEYFEVYNTTGSPIDMAGWEIVDLTNASENHTISSSLIVPSNGYTVLGVNADSGTNGGVTVDYEYGSNLFLGNGADELSLQCSSTVIDEVSWDGGTDWPDPTGASMELSSTAMNSTDNDNGANWGEATSEITTGGDLGTPGSANDFTLSTNQFETNNFRVYPNPTSLGYVTLSSKNSAKMNISVFDILGKQVLNETVSNNILNVSSLTSGVYIMNISQDNARITKKLVIQ